MADQAPEYVHRHHWYTHPGIIAFGVFFVAVAGGFIGLVFRAYTNVVTNNQPRFTTNPTAGQVASSVDVLGVSENDPSLGPADAPVTIVEFGDFQCPYCKEAFPIVRQLMHEYDGRVRFVFRDYPITESHALAVRAAEAGMCAWEQGSNEFWSLHDRFYTNQDQISEQTISGWAQLAGVDSVEFEACLNSGRYQAEVEDDYADGVRLGVRGTPTFFVNGRKIEGVVPKDVFVQIIEDELP